MSAYLDFVQGPFREMLRGAIDAHIKHVGKEVICLTKARQYLDRSVELMAEQESVIGHMTTEEFEEECERMCNKVQDEVKSWRGKSPCGNPSCMACRLRQATDDIKSLSKTKEALPEMYQGPVKWLLDTLQRIADKPLHDNRESAELSRSAFMFLLAKSLVADQLLEENAELRESAKKLTSTVSILTDSLTDQGNN